MKAISKGKILKKLKTIKAIGYLKPDKILHSNQLSGVFSHLNSKFNANSLPPLSPVLEESNKFGCSNVEEQEHGLEDQELESSEVEGVVDDKENVKPRKGYQNLGFLKENSEEKRVLKKKIEELGVDELKKDDYRRPGLESEGVVDDKESIKPRKGDGNLGFLKENSEERRVLKKKIEVLEVDELKKDGYRRPDLYSGTLFDPKLLAAFEQAVVEARAREEERRVVIEEEIMKDIVDDPNVEVQDCEEFIDPLLDFEHKCPPGGEECVVFYTTSLRGIRKTFEDCHSVRFLLESFRVLYYERDVSMHSEYREELWKVLDGKVLPPRLFIKGRDIGGSEKILTLHEQGKFRPLFEGIPVDETRGFCDSCGGVRFVMCFNCSGSQKIVCEEDGKQMRCPKCNENGVIVCPLCC